MRLGSSMTSVGPGAAKHDVAAVPGPLRVLQVVPTLTVGGAERLAALLARHLRRAGHDAAVVSLYPPAGTWIEAELRADGVPLHFLDKRPGPDVRMLPRLARLVAAFRPDVVHTHLYALQYVYPVVALARRPRVVHTVHNVAEREAHRPGRVLQHLAFRTGVVHVAIGDAVAESVRRVYRLRPRHVVANGIPLEDCVAPAGAREQVRRSLGIPPEAATFVAVGRLEPQKDHRTLLAAFASERLAAAGARLLVAGDGPLRGELERQASALGVAGRVAFLGVRGDVARLLAAADAFVLASAYEGNPLTVMEAMAAGRPVIATAVGCVPELVVEGTGRVVPPGDAGALAEALHEVVARPDLARARGAAAARVARARFDVSSTVRAYEAIYREGT
jgi:glycosyltransferase involved in cell wall biosynthesis